MKKPGVLIGIAVFFIGNSLLFASSGMFHNFYVLHQDSRELSLLCQKETSTIDYKQYFTDPEVTGEIVYVIFKAKMEKEGDDAWALALFHGFKYAYTASAKAKKLAVGILFTNETGKIYYIERTVYTDFVNGKISNDEFVRRIQTENVE